MTAERAEALVVPAVNPLAYANRSELARLARKNRLPTLYGEIAYADAGGLIAARAPDLAALLLRVDQLIE